MSKTDSVKIKHLPVAKRVVVFGEPDWFDQLDKPTFISIHKQIKRN